MKKLLFFLIPLLIIACNGDQKPGTKLVTPASERSVVIDTTIFEDGEAPVADIPNARVNKEEKQKKEKVSCGFGHHKFNTRKRPKEEAPGGAKGKPPKPPKPPAPSGDTTDPILGGGLSMSNIFTNRISLSWPAASDNVAVTGYDLYRNGVKINLSNITTLGFVDIGLTPATTYTYYYVAKDAAGNYSANSPTVTGRTLNSDGSGGGGGTPGDNNVIYLNFLGKTVANTMWNTSGTFTVGESGLVQGEIDYVAAQVRAHYTDFNVNVTTNKSEYDAAPFGRKIEIVITEDYQWYGQAGGVAYINSFFWTDGTPGFVFSLLLNYNTHNIAEAAAHEAGHTLGLRHQVDCENGVITSQYSYGKTMGVSYNVPLGIWFTGPSSLSCAIQNDVEKLTSALGLRQMAYWQGNKFRIPLSEAYMVSVTRKYYIKPKEN